MSGVIANTTTPLGLKNRAISVAKLLKAEYPNPKTELDYKNEYELAIAVMLSAQTTDKKVNQVTVELFKKYSGWSDLANAQLVEVQKIIHGVNFHLGKAERLIAAGRIVSSEFGVKLPQTIDGLKRIPGVARKSANVIMQELWKIADGIVVDTHITRTAQRLGFTKNTDAIKIEKELMELIPKEYWGNYSSAMVLHGRYICVARKPKCGECVLNKVCPSAFSV